MNLTLQKKLVSKAFKCSPKRVKIDPSKYGEVKEAITRFDVKGLVNKGIIEIVPKTGISNFHHNIKRKQKRKGRQKGHGSSKGRAGARKDKKRFWINAIRAQRSLLKKLKAKKLLDLDNYKILYKKAKGGFFRSTRHIKIFAEEQKMLKK